jgi:aryl-alcohol dehydrogenase-like predicted oxidoreductase
MTKRMLGKSDMEVTPIGLGTWQFSNASGLAGGLWKSLDDGTTAAIVKAALDGGINWFDTAAVYGGGNSERSLASALAANGVTPGSVRIATKWWPVLKSYRDIPRSIQERIDCLSPYPIDLYQIHQPYSVSSVARQVDAMADLVDEGKVRWIGVSNFSAKAMEEAHARLAARGMGLVSNQVRINLLDRSVERNGVLETARRLGVTLIAYSPLAQGILSGRFHEEGADIRSVPAVRRAMSSLSPATIRRTSALVSELKRIGSAHGTSPAQVALNWLANRWGDVVVAIPGASRPSQAAEAAGAMGFELGRGELDSIDRLSRELT